MSKELISENNDFTVELVSLKYRSSRIKALKIDGKTGNITLTGATSINGQDLSNLSNVMSAVGTDGKVVKTAIAATSFRSFCTLGNNGAGHITATGVKVGDKVIMVADTTNHLSRASLFEATVTVNDQIQQTGTDLSAATLVILVLAQS